MRYVFVFSGIEDEAIISPQKQATQKPKPSIETIDPPESPSEKRRNPAGQLFPQKRWRNNYEKSVASFSLRL
jgi:hypothetical protein